MDVAITLENLGKAYGALGDNTKMKALLECALVIKEREYGPRSRFPAATSATHNRQRITARDWYDANTHPHPAYPTWVLNFVPLKITSMVVYVTAIVAGAAPAPLPLVCAPCAAKKN